MDAKAMYDKVLAEVKKHIAGKTDVIKLIFIAIVADGHVLLEGVPGVAKTTISKTVADAIDAKFDRIQGTPDLDIRDIIGYAYLDESKNIQVKKGPIFTNILLIDELNRAPPRTTTALLEALEERQVTMGNSTMPLDRPFIALATQNPLNIEGTTQLPKVLADRFLMRIAVDYPSMEEEQEMLRIKEREEKIKTEKVLSINDIISLQESVNSVKISDSMIAYITAIVNATRNDIHVVMGGSPRAEISFMKCAKAKALIEGRSEVIADDIKFLAKPVLSHRLVVRSTGGIGVNGVIDGIVATMPAP
ncbi:MAG: MoxR family ATPase [Candidatus Marsarchaeota archaeon]|jgi:MoxR-like ATPase|nr:MoxR family ATPase [Candidatus Marsarchaeota archaeon]MCL5418921.1 MoxR family ATPase [Candidatus Marsarchaeota archaeon]